MTATGNHHFYKPQVEWKDLLQKAHPEFLVTVILKRLDFSGPTFVYYHVDAFTPIVLHHHITYAG